MLVAAAAAEVVDALLAAAGVRVSVEELLLVSFEVLPPPHAVSRLQAQHNKRRNSLM
jgi:hypothetical protein